MTPAQEALYAKLVAERERGSFETLKGIYESRYGPYDGPDNAMPREGGA